MGVRMQGPFKERAAIVREKLHYDAAAQAPDDEVQEARAKAKAGQRRLVMAAGAIHFRTARKTARGRKSARVSCNEVV